MLNKVTIYGERCSGTNYLEQLLVTNFEINIIWNYGWKHFFGYNDLSNSDDVLFIGIVRNIYDWINSFYREQHHLSLEFRDLSKFLDSEFYSVYDLQNNEIMQDRNLENNKRYKNIFELRHVKNKFLIEIMPKLVKNYLLITYDDLINNFNGIMNEIKKYNLIVKPNIEFPLNIFYYKNEKEKLFVKKNNEISKKMIFSRANLYYEKMLFNKMSFKDELKEK